MDCLAKHWVAGILEGEGCFSVKRRGNLKGNGYPYLYPTVEVNMGDEDVIRKLRDVTGIGNVQGPYGNPKKPDWTPMWRWTIQNSSLAVEFMKEIVDLMGARRKRKIMQILVDYDETLRARKAGEVDGSNPC